MLQIVKDFVQSEELAKAGAANQDKGQTEVEGDGVPTVEEINTETSK